MPEFSDLIGQKVCRDYNRNCTQSQTKYTYLKKKTTFVV